MQSEKARFRLDLRGAFRLHGPDGARVEIASRRGATLIAMLATAPGGERTRSWLQERLWGSRAPEQASGSLRKELHQLRTILNISTPSLLISARNTVRLNLSLLTINLDGGDEVAGSSSEFLEGLDIRGEEGVEDWLREHRRALNTAWDKRPPEAALAAEFRERPALAVLRFQNLTDFSAADFVAEGLSEDLINRLSRLRWLPVIDRSSSFSAGLEQLDTSIVGERLRARYVLEGRLRGTADSAWLSAVLTDVESAYVIWSHRVHLPSGASTGGLESFVDDLVAALESRIDHAEQERARVHPQNDLSLTQMIWRGRWHLNRFTREDAAIARCLFDEALALDPHSSEALVQATFARAWSLWAVRGNSAEIGEMRKLAQRAISADWEDGRAHMLAGVAEMWLRRPDRAKVLLRQAIALNPSLAMAYAQLGGCFNLTGEPEAALEHLRAAISLSPNDALLFYVKGELAMAHCIIGRLREAIQHADCAIVRRPAYWYAHVVKIDALRRLGDERGMGQACCDMRAAIPNFAIENIDWIPFVETSWNRQFVASVQAAMTISMTEPDGSAVAGL